MLSSIYLSYKLFVENFLTLEIGTEASTISYYCDKATETRIQFSFTV